MPPAGFAALRPPAAPPGGRSLPARRFGSSTRRFQESTVEMAQEIDRLNGTLIKEGRPYLLIGPGRWGSADRWLGIPVQWKHISGVRAMVEMRNQVIKADPSQGSHFFQNITSLGIHYLTVTEDSGSADHFDWPWVEGLPAVTETTFLRHVRLEEPFLLKIDGRTCEGVMIAP